MNGGDDADAPAAASLDRDDLTPEGQVALEALLFRLAADEFVHAERLTEWEIFAPTIESDLALANVAQDEFGHARLWFDLLEDLGYAEPEYIWERDPADWTHSTLVERPFDDGDWADVVVRSYLYDVAEDLRLDAVAGSGIRELVDPTEKLRAEEAYHLEHAQIWLERLCDDDIGRENVQSAADRDFEARVEALCRAIQERRGEDGIDVATVGDVAERARSAPPSRWSHPTT